MAQPTRYTIRQFENVVRARFPEMSTARIQRAAELMGERIGDGVLSIPDCTAMLNGMQRERQTRGANSYDPIDAFSAATWRQAKRLYVGQPAPEPWEPPPAPDRPVTPARMVEIIEAKIAAGCQTEKSEKFLRALADHIRRTGRFGVPEGSAAAVRRDARAPKHKAGAGDV